MHNPSSTLAGLLVGPVVKVEHYRQNERTELKMEYADGRVLWLWPNGQRFSWVDIPANDRH
jgi:hypothetical protein